MVIFIIFLNCLQSNKMCIHDVFINFHLTQTSVFKIEVAPF